MNYSEDEYRVVKGGALKYSIDHLASPSFEKEFNKPVKDWVLQSDDETRLVGGKKLWIQRTKPTTIVDAKKVKPDFMVLAKGGQLTKDEFVQLLESGALAIADPKAVAKLCASRLGQQETKYNTETTPNTTPRLRWPTKGALQPWFYAMRTIADLSEYITKAAKSKAVKTIDKILAQV